MIETSLPDRFWSKVQRTEECWLWTASTVRGYGRFFVCRVEGKRVEAYAYRLSYEDQVGPIPPGMELDHLCRNPLCVNPEHLEPVTHAENCRRGVCGAVNAARQLARTHCKNGHSWEEHGRIVQRTGKKNFRQCRQCEREANARYKTARLPLEDAAAQT